jgi:hypothetical protein
VLPVSKGLYDHLENSGLVVDPVVPISKKDIKDFADRVDIQPLPTEGVVFQYELDWLLASEWIDQETYDRIIKQCEKPFPEPYKERNNKAVLENQQFLKKHFGK